MSPGLQTEKTSKEQSLSNTGYHQSIQLQTDVANSETEVHGVLEQAAAVACVIEDNSLEEYTGATIKDADLLPLYNVEQKETVFDPEPIMSPDDIFPKLAGSQFYSSFDFCKGYWAIPMEEQSKDYTTFVSSRGLMRYRVMQFGMVNSGSTYNRMIRKLLDGTHNLESYVDDILGHTKNWKEHMKILHDFFERARKANLSLKPSKCKIGYGSVDFLGHTLHGDCIGPQTESVGRILQTKYPKTKKQCRSLLGMVNTKLCGDNCSNI